jgi:hypothetical protein
MTKYSIQKPFHLGTLHEGRYCFFFLVWFQKSVVWKFALVINEVAWPCCLPQSLTKISINL